jgi:hypothetical protein
MNTIQSKIKEKIIEISNKGLTDKSTHHSYEEIYPYLLENFIDKKLYILEIGVAIGGGLKILSDLFPNSYIYGLDIDYSQLKIDIINTNITLLPEQDQSDPKLIQSLPNFDIIIEDASHDYNKSMDTFNIFKDKLNKNGVYIIEDIYPHYKPYYDQDNRFKIYDLRHIKNRQDDVLAVYYNE